MSTKTHRPSAPLLKDAHRGRPWTAKIVKKQAKKPKVSQVSPATDTAKEGEVVYWNVSGFQDIEQMTRKPDPLYTELRQKYGRGPFTVIKTKQRESGEVLYIVAKQQREILITEGNCWFNSEYFIQ